MYRPTGYGPAPTMEQHVLAYQDKRTRYSTWLVRDPRPSGSRLPWVATVWVEKDQLYTDLDRREFVSFSLGDDEGDFRVENRTVEEVTRRHPETEWCYIGESGQPEPLGEETQQAPLWDEEGRLELPSLLIKVRPDTGRSPQWFWSVGDGGLPWQIGRGDSEETARNVALGYARIEAARIAGRWQETLALLELAQSPKKESAP